MKMIAETIVLDAVDLDDGVVCDLELTAFYWPRGEDGRGVRPWIDMTPSGDYESNIVLRDMEAARALVTALTRLIERVDREGIK